MSCRILKTYGSYQICHLLRIWPSSRNRIYPVGGPSTRNSLFWSWNTTWNIIWKHILIKVYTVIHYVAFHSWHIAKSIHFKAHSMLHKGITKSIRSNVKSMIPYKASQIHSTEVHSIQGRWHSIQAQPRYHSIQAKCRYAIRYKL